MSRLFFRGRIPIFLGIEFIITIIEIDIEQLIFYWYVPNKHFSLTSKLINSIIISMLSILTLQHHNLYVWSVILMYLSNYVFLYHESKNLIYSLLYTLMSYFLIQVDEYVACHFLSALAISKCVEDNSVWIIFILVNLIKIILFLIGIYIIRKQNKYIESISYIEKIPKDLNFIIAFYIFIFIIISWCQETQVDISGSSYWFVSIVLLLLILIFIGSVYFLVKINDYRIEIKQLNIIFNNKIEEINEFRKFRHDYKNLLSILSIYLIENRIEEAKSLLKDISGYSEQILSEDNLVYLNKINIFPIKSILFLKMEEILNEDIQINFKVSGEVNKVGISILDLVRVLSNLIDNAKEACLEIENPYIDIYIIQKMDYLIIDIENSCLNSTNISLENLKKPGFTTKSDHTGLGLFYLNDLANHHPNFKYNIEKKEGKFKVTIWIENNFR